MVNIKTKYIILFWIIILILFTFFCINRLKYLKEKYDTMPIITYINNVQTQNKITDLTDPPQCKNLFDDNIKVQSLGYSNCENAYSDYITKGYDINNKFGQPNSLADLCPVSTKSELYKKCITSLLKKFTNTTNMVDNINIDMTKSINERLKYRSGVLNDVQNELNPLIYNKNHSDFNDYMKSNNSVGKYKDDTLILVKNYYQDRYNGGLGFKESKTEGSKPIEGFVGNTSVYTVKPAIKKLFFGYYKPINGQFIAFNDLIISIIQDNTAVPTLFIPPVQTEPSETDTDPTPTAPSPSSTSSETDTDKPKKKTNIMLSINSNSNNLNVIYDVVSIDNYNALPNAIKMFISNQNIISNTNDSGNSQTILQLLNTLGLRSPTQLIMIYDEFKSSENILHKTYKLVNDNLDTILLLNKM